METPTVATKVGIETSKRRRFTFVRMVAQDQVSGHFEYGLEVSGSAGLELDDMLDMGMAVRIDMPGPIPRYFHGVVDAVTALPPVGRTERYRMILRPALVRLVRCSHRRVFAEQRATDVIAQVLNDHAIDHEFLLTGDHADVSSIIQYDETDLDLVLRLMEREGIFYFYRHEHDGHVLVLADSPSGMTAYTGYDEQRLIGAGGSGEGLLSLDPLVRARVEQMYLDDVDFNRPHIDLGVAAGRSRRGTCATLFDYPGGYTDIDVGRQLAERRLQARQAGTVSATGQAASRGIVAGYRFALKDHPRKEMNAEHVVLRTLTHIEGGSVTAAGDTVAAEIRCELATTPSGAALPLPAPERTRQLHGAHTASVIGPGGRSLDVDALGRVKVRFHWQADDDSALPARVRQAAAGTGRAALMLPEVGDEVLVAFEQGDERKPVVIGSLFNGAVPPPLDLPDDATTALLRSGSPATATFNELQIDNRTGAERVAVQAARDFILSVMNDAHVQIGDAMQQTVGGNALLSIGGNRSENVGGDAVLTVGGDLSAAAGGETAVSLADRCALAVAKALSVSGNASVSVDAAKSITLSSDTDILISNKKASIHLKANGDVVIKASRVFIEATGKIQFEGADIVEKEG